MKEPIKVLILTDGRKAKKWIVDIVQFVLDSSRFEIVGVVVNTATNSSKSAFFYRVLRLLDRKVFKAKTNPFQELVLPIDSQLIYETYPFQKQYSDWVDDDCLAFVAQKQPDIILRFGFRILRGSLLGIPKFGVWSLHHGDNKVNRGGPPAFWEVVNQESISGITLQQITEDLDGGKVIGRAFTKTDLLYFHRNQVTVFETGSRLFQEKLAQLANGTLNVEKPSFDFYSYPLYKNPSNTTSCSLFFKFIYRIAKKNFFNFLYEQQWIICHSKSNNQEETIYRFQQLIPPKGISWADPFPVVFEGKLYLFAEEIAPSKPGKIVCFEYESDNKCFGKPRTIIQEKYHLSYPHLFEYKENWYMIPETGDAEKVILFKATQFPYEWEEEKVLVSGKKLYDVTPFEYQGKWYCFASERIANSTMPNDLLHLYLLHDGPLGTWTPHPLSPIKIDVRGGRSAGKVFKKDGRWYRPAQLGAPKYGYAIELYEILKLTENEYEEQLVETILPNWDATILATHTFNEANGWQFIDCQRWVRKF